MNISSLVETVLKKHLGDEMPDLQKDISSNLEVKLFLTIDLNKPFKEAKKKFIKHYFNDILTLSLGNISLAAKKANLHRRHLHRKLNELEIDPNIHRKEMIKPEEYMKTNIQSVLEESLSDFKNEEKIKPVYSNLEDISEVIANHFDDVLSYDEALSHFEKQYIESILKQNNFDIKRASNKMNISQRTLYRKINKLNIAVS